MSDLVARTDRALRLANAAHARAAHRGSPEQATAARIAFNEAKVQAWVAKTLADAPPYLTPETKRRLARLLTGGEDR